MMVMQNSTPTPTAFRYVAHVPPKAIGPQFAQAPAPTLSSQTQRLLIASAGLAIGIPIAYLLIRSMVLR
jgi:hypothetical protein